MSDGNSIKLIAREEARLVIHEHLTLCPLAQDKIADRLRAVEITQARLIGFMAGSGLLGGISAFGLSKLFP
jgi:hypothetical protein